MDEYIEQGQYQDMIGRETPKIGTYFKSPVILTSAQLGESHVTLMKEGVEARQVPESIRNRTLHFHAAPTTQLSPAAVKPSSRGVEL